MNDLYGAARRLDLVQFSPVRRVLERASGLAGRGRDILHVEIGEPDFDTPSDIVEATVRALAVEKRTHYPPNRGVLKLRNAISEMLKEQFHVSYDGASEVLVTCGAAEGIFDAVMALVNEGDEVIVMSPAYMNYENCIRMAGASCVKVELLESAGYQVDEAALEEAVTERTRMIVLTNPNNPTGTVMNRESLQKIAAVARAHDLVVLSDEIYAAMHYGVDFVSFASLPGMKERTVLVSGFSKCFAMTGWRIGYVACDARFYSQILKVHQYATNCIPTFIQEGLAAGMRTEKTAMDVKAMVLTFDERRRMVLEMLSQVPGVSCSGADGAFYVFVNVSGTGLSGTEFAERLLEEQGVALVPGAAFGDGCRNCVRISYGTSIDVLDKALQRIREFAAALCK